MVAYTVQLNLICVEHMQLIVKRDDYTLAIANKTISFNKNKKFNLIVM